MHSEGLLFLCEGSLVCMVCIHLFSDQKGLCKGWHSISEWSLYADWCVRHFFPPSQSTKQGNIAQKNGVHSSIRFSEIHKNLCQGSLKLFWRIDTFFLFSFKMSPVASSCFSVELICFCVYKCWRCKMYLICIEDILRRGNKHIQSS